MDGIARPHMIWSKRAIFVLIALLICFTHLLPLDFGPQRWAAPDLLVGFAFAWVIRRPEFVPPLLLAGVLLMADLLLQRPPGLWALLVLIGCEYLRARDRVGGDGTFAGEWLAVAAVMVAITALMWLGLMMFAVPQPGLSVDLSRLFFTVLAYPVIVWITHSVLGIERISPAEADRLGAR